MSWLIPISHILVDTHISSLGFSHIFLSLQATLPLPLATLHLPEVQDSLVSHLMYPPTIDCFALCTVCDLIWERAPKAFFTDIEFLGLYCRCVRTSSRVLLYVCSCSGSVRTVHVHLNVQPGCRICNYYVWLHNPPVLNYPCRHKQHQTQNGSMQLQ